MHPTMFKALLTARKSLWGFGLGLASLAYLILLLYPSIQKVPAAANLMKAYPKELLAVFGLSGSLSILSPAGYLQAELFSLMIPLLLIIFAIGQGSWAIAGEEKMRTLDPSISLSRPEYRAIAHRDAR